MKTYIKPTVKEIKVSTEGHLANTSDQTLTIGGNVEGGFEGSAKEDFGEDLW